MQPDFEILVRPFGRGDAPRMLTLMRGLAMFERYIDLFAVTEADLIEHGLGAAPRFGAFVAERGGEVIGLAVHYRIPWTFDMRPVVVLKELFVAEAARGFGAGRALFREVKAYASAIGASRLSWTVLPDNAPAKRFYAIEGGAPDTTWEPWSLPLPFDHRSDLQEPHHG